MKTKANPKMNCLKRSQFSLSPNFTHNKNKQASKKDSRPLAFCKIATCFRQGILVFGQMWQFELF